MGFDVTFHPVDKHDLIHFFFDVVDDPSLAESRARELTDDAVKQEAINKIYDDFPQFLQDMKDFDDSTYRNRESFAWKVRKFLQGYPSRYYEIGPTFGYAAAAIAGYRQPYWYCRGTAISFLSQYAPMLKFVFTPLPRLHKSRLSAVTDMFGGMISSNFCGSGYIAPEKLRAVETYVQALALRKGPQGRPWIEELFSEEGLSALREAIAYCKEKSLGLMEASDVAVPMMDACASEPNNLRAVWLEE